MSMLNDPELYNVHAQRGKIENWSILTKNDCVKYKRNALALNKVKFKTTEGKCQKGYRQIKDENRTCQEVDSDNMT